MLFKAERLLTELMDLRDEYMARQPVNSSWYKNERALAVEAGIEMCIQKVEELKAQPDSWEARPLVLTLDDFMAQPRPCWIEHKENETFTGWGMFYAERYPLLKINTLKVGSLLLAPERYGVSWIALSDKPDEETRKGLWKDEKCTGDR